MTGPGPRETKARRAAAVRGFVRGERERRRALIAAPEPTADIRALSRDAYRDTKAAWLRSLRGA